MAITFGALCGGNNTKSFTGNKFNPGPSYSTAVAAGKLVVLIVGIDNLGTTDADESAISSVTDTAGNVFTKAREHTKSGGAALGGATCSIWYSVLTAAVTTSNTLNINIGTVGTRGAAAATMAYFNVSVPVIVVEASAVSATTGANPPSLALTTANVECLRVRGSASETSTVTNWTATASWTVFSVNGTTGGTGTANIGARGEFRIVTATTGASTPTITLSADHANVIVAFKEGVVTNQAVTASAGSTATLAMSKVYGKAITGISVGVAAVSLQKSYLRSVLASAASAVALIADYVSPPTGPRTGFGRLTRAGPSGYGIRRGWLAEAAVIDSPDDIPGLLLWLDAMDEATITASGGLVSAIANKGSVGGSFTQSTDAQKFSLVTAANGPALRGSRSDHNTFMTGGTTSAYDIGQMTVFGVAQQETIPGAGYDMLLTRIDAENYDGWTFGLYWSTAAAKVSLQFEHVDATNDYNYSYNAAERAFASNRVTVIVGRRDSSTYKGGVMGNPITNGDWYSYVAPVGTYRVMLGGWDYSAGTAQWGLFRGDIHEVLLYDNPLSDANRQKIEGYLAWKWGLEADLPVDHPYYDAPPWPLGGISTPITIAAAAASTALLTMGRAFARALSAASTSTAILARVSASLRSIIATGASAVTIARLTAALRSIIASSTSTVTLARVTARLRSIIASAGSTATLGALKVFLRAVTVTGASTVTLARGFSPLRSITATGASTITIIKRTGKQITATGAAAVSITRLMARSITAAAGSVATLTAGLVGLSRAITVTAGGVVTLARLPAKVVSVTATSAVTLARLFAPIRLISVVGAATVTLQRTTAGGRMIAVATASTITLAAIRAFLRPITIAGAAVVTLRRATSKAITAASAGAVVIVKRTGKTLSAAGAALVSLARSTSKRITLATGSAATVVAVRAFLRGVTAASTSAASLARLTGKALTAAGASTVTLARLATLRLTIAVQGAALVTLAKRMSKAVSAAAASAVTILPFRGTVKLISAAAASVATVARGMFVAIFRPQASVVTMLRQRGRAVTVAGASIVIIGKGGITRLISVATASVATVISLGLTLGRHALERMLHLLPISRTASAEAKDRRLNLMRQTTTAHAKDEMP